MIGQVGEILGKWKYIDNTVQQSSIHFQRRVPHLISRDLMIPGRISLRVSRYPVIRSKSTIMMFSIYPIFRKLEQGLIQFCSRFRRPFWGFGSNNIIYYIIILISSLFCYDIRPAFYCIGRSLKIFCESITKYSNIFFDK